MFLALAPFLALSTGMGIRKELHTDEVLTEGDTGSKRVIRRRLTGMTLAGLGAGLGIRHGLKTGGSPAKMALAAGLGAITGAIFGDAITTKLPSDVIVTSAMLTGTAAAAAALLSHKAQPLIELGLTKASEIARSTNTGRVITDHLAGLTTKAESKMVRNFFTKTLPAGLVSSIGVSHAHREFQTDMIHQKMRWEAGNVERDRENMEKYREATRLKMSTSTIYTSRAGGNFQQAFR